MSNTVVVLSEQEVKDAVGLTKFLGDTAQDAHYIIDMLIVIDSISRDEDMPEELRQKIQELKGKAYTAASRIRGRHKVIMNHIQYQLAKEHL